MVNLVRGQGLLQIFFGRPQPPPIWDKILELDWRVGMVNAKPNKAKRFAKQQRSNVIKALACVYCYFLNAELNGYQRKEAISVSC